MAEYTDQELAFFAMTPEQKQFISASPEEQDIARAASAPAPAPMPTNPNVKGYVPPPAPAPTNPNTNKGYVPPPAPAPAPMPAPVPSSPVAEELRTPTPPPPTYTQAESEAIFNAGTPAEQQYVMDHTAELLRQQAAAEEDARRVAEGGYTQAESEAIFNAGTPLEQQYVMDHTAEAQRLQAAADAAATNQAKALESGARVDYSAGTPRGGALIPTQTYTGHTGYLEYGEDGQSVGTGGGDPIPLQYMQPDEALRARPDLAQPGTPQTAQFAVSAPSNPVESIAKQMGGGAGNDLSAALRTQNAEGAR